MSDIVDYRAQLLEKIKVLSGSTWERLTMAEIQPWLEQFTSADSAEDDEQLHALYLLSEFLYFGQREIRVLLKSVFRDLYKTPILQSIRRDLGDTLDRSAIDAKFRHVLDKTRFLGMGNPSESGAHLLYYFRQENSLPKYLFINTHQIFRRGVSQSGVNIVVRDSTIERYVFIDDLCGSGTQAKEYSEEIIDPLRSKNPSVKVSYFVLFATSTGLDAVRKTRRFDEVNAIFTLDQSFKAFESNSRIFTPEQHPFYRLKIRDTCAKHGARLCPAHPLGYKDGQLLLGFNHNTPDNSLPIFWAEESVDGAWIPVFKRYQKIYG